MSNATPASPASFGEMLKYVRKRAHLTQRDLGIAVGYSETYITRLENDTRPPDPIVVKARFIDALGLMHEPQLAQRLIDLAEQTRMAKVDAGVSAIDARTNLPAPLTRFIGRQDELRSVIEHVQSHRLVTLTGSGGVGKTRLAIEAGAQMLSHFEDGVQIAELAPLSDASLVAQNVAGAFKVTNQAGNTYADALKVLIGTKHVLIILDNCEHVVHACAELVEALLRACPNLHILATSREPLSVAGESVWRVPSLRAEESAALFADRATAVKSDFSLNAANDDDVNAVCARLDGIPLAIELAASRLSALTVKQLAARLDDRFALLTGGSRTALPRHQTLRALIAWSYDLLTDQERTLLRRLAVFAGGWTAEAAKDVCATPRSLEGEMAALNAPNVLPLLISLVDKSLVIVIDDREQTRFTMLETIRQFAWAQLEQAGETTFVQGRHAQYFLAHLKATAPAKIRETNNPVQIDHMTISSLSWIASLVHDRENLRSAVVWSLGQENDINTGIQLVMWQKPLWTLRGPREEARRWLEVALEHVQSPEYLHERAYLLTYFGSFLNRLEEYGRARKAFRDALLIFKQLNDRFGVMYTLNQQSNDPFKDIDEFERDLQELLRLAYELDDSIHAGAALWFLGIHYAWRRNNLPRALDYFAESLRTLPEEEIGIRHIASYYQAQALREAGKPENTLERIFEALAFFRMCGFVLGVVAVLRWLGKNALEECDPETARSFLIEGLELAYRDGGKQFGVPYFGPFAVLAAYERKPIACATLYVINQVMGNSTFTPMTQKLIDSARAQLDEEALKKAEAAGRSMTYDQAVAFALAL